MPFWYWVLILNSTVTRGHSVGFKFFEICGELSFKMFCAQNNHVDGKRLVIYRKFSKTQTNPQHQKAGQWLGGGGLQRQGGRAQRAGGRLG